MTNLSKWAAIGGVAIFLLIIASGLISFSNEEIDLRNSFEQKISERTAFYDKLWKTISQKAQIAVKNDSSFQNTVNVIMSERKDAPGLAMKWIRESNPNANFDQVSILYQDLSREISAQREGFLIQEKVLQDIVRVHSNLIQKFPNNVYNMFFGRQKLIYKPITSDRTDEVIKSGKDNNTSVF